MRNDTKDTVIGFVAFWLFFILLFYTARWIALIIQPLLGKMVRDFFFFWDYTVFLPRGFTINDPSAPERYLYGGPSTAIAVIFWIVVSLLFAWASRRLGFRRQMLLACPVILLASLLALFVIKLAGYYPA